MNADDNDKLWQVLGKARQPAVSPFFARNVLRAIRLESQEQGALTSRSFLSQAFKSLHRWTWQLAIAGTCVVAALITVVPSLFVRHHQSAPVEATLAPQIVGNPDYEVIKHLDELVADEESSLWLDDSVH